MGTLSRRFTLSALWVVGVTVAVFLAAPPVVRLWMLAAVPALGLLAVGWGRRRYRPPRVPWLLLTGVLLASVVAGTSQALAREVTGVTTIAYLVAYSFAAAAIVAVTRRGVHPEPYAWLDAAIALVAVGTLELQLLVFPHLKAGVGAAEPLMAAALPTYDLVLLGLMMRMLSRRPVRVPAQVLILAAFGSSIAADVVVGWRSIGGDYTVGVPTDVFPLLCFLGVSLAAVHPSMARLGEAAAIERRTRVPSLLALLPAGAIVPGLLIAHQLGMIDVSLPLLAVAGLILFALALLRAIILLAAGERVAGRDPLTGLPNLRALRLELDSRLHADADDLAVAYLGLDELQAVNSAHGHGVGDTLITQVAERVATRLRVGEMLARVGGAEFAVLARCRADEVAALAERLLAAFADPFALDGLTLRLTASLGLVLDPGARGVRPDPQDVIADADLAMYAAKQSGVNAFAVYRSQLRAQLLGRQELAADLRAALDDPEGHGLWLAYQPVMGIDGVRMVGVEALLRWNHPRRGPLGPAEFLPVAAAAGMSALIDEFVLREALAQLHAWALADPRFTTARMAVNVTAPTVIRTDLVNLVLTTARETGARPDQLVLEFTEQAAVPDDANLALSLNALTSTGVGLSIDDFGTGYSALLYLQRFPVRSVKLDRSLIDTIADGGASPLLRAVVALGHSLGLLLLAEGVEREDQMAPLRALKVHLAQGYLLGMPMPPADLLTFAAGRPVGPLPQFAQLTDDVEADAVTRIPDLAGGGQPLPEQRHQRQ